jgi:hypothetical protein
VLRLLALASLTALLLSACGDDGGKTAPDTATPLPSRWDASAVWDYYGAAVSGAVQNACHRSTTMLQPGEPCVVDAMRAAGASARAVEFYETKRYFLASFQEQGRVDYGQGGAFWMNMGRPTPQLFLNGSPDIIEAKIPDDYKTNASYATLLGQSPQPFPWLEYGKLNSSTTDANGGQRLVIEYPLRVCRACPDVGYLPIAYMFNAQGQMGMSQTLPLKMP